MSTCCVAVAGPVCPWPGYISVLDLMFCCSCWTCVSLTWLYQCPWPPVLLQLLDLCVLDLVVSVSLTSCSVAVAGPVCPWPGCISVLDLLFCCSCWTCVSLTLTTCSFPTVSWQRPLSTTCRPRNTHLQHSVRTCNVFKIPSPCVLFKIAICLCTVCWLRR